MAAERDWESKSLAQGFDDSDDEFRWFGECSDEEAECEGAEETPGAQFVSFMLKLLFKSDLSAMMFCTIMYLACAAGIQECKPYGLKPGCPSGHYSRKVKRQLGWLNSKAFLYVPCPIQGKHDI